MSANQDREIYRKEFFERLTSKRGNIAKAAKGADVAPNSVSRWGIEGNSFPTIHQVLEIAKALKVSPSWLAFGETYKSEDSKIDKDATRRFSCFRCRASG